MSNQEIENKTEAETEKSEKVKEQEKIQKKRGQWSNKVEYLLSMIGYAVGLGNVWRFPYIAYQNGGGAFLIPYFVMLFLTALPLFYIEVVLGQFCSLSSFHAFNCVPLMKGIGISMVLISVFLGMYYNVVLAYTVNYFMKSFISPLPWTTCNHTFSVPDCSEVRNTNNSDGNSTKVLASENYWERGVLGLSEGIEVAGSVRGDLLLQLIFSWIVVGTCTVKGVKSVGKAVYFTALFPYLVLTILLINALTYKGATDGIYFFLEPKWEQITKPKVWQQAAAQIFYSLSICLGGIITLSSYNGFKNNCYKDMWIVSMVNSFTSIYAGLTIFSTLGVMAHRLGVSVANVTSSGRCNPRGNNSVFVVLSPLAVLMCFGPRMGPFAITIHYYKNTFIGPGLAFVVYPEAVAQLPGSNFWAVIFFVMLFTLGLDTMFAITETVISMLIDCFPEKLLEKRTKVTVVTCIVFFISGILITTEGGFYWISLIDTYPVGYSLLFTAIAELIAISYMYGINRLMEDIELMLGVRPHVLWKIMMKYASPLMLIIILFAALASHQILTQGDYVFPIWADVLGWLMVVAVLSPMPLCAAYVMRKAEGETWRERMKNAMKPSSMWRPYRDDNCTGRYALADLRTDTASVPASAWNSGLSDGNANEKVDAKEGDSPIVKPDYNRH